VPHPLEVRLLHRERSFAIADVRCRAHAHVKGPEEQAGGYEVIFPRRGQFVREVEGEATYADANAVLFVNPGEVQRVSHPTCGGDDCTVFTFDRVTVEDIGRPFPRRGTGAPTELHAFAERLRRHALGDAPDPLALHVGALRLLEALLDVDVPVETERTLAVKVVLARNLASGISLDALSREVACSPFHLARIFRRTTGIPIHRYLNRLRLRVVLSRLGDADGLAALAHDVGFSSHAHLTDAFRREFGVPPLAWRRPPNARELREMSKILEA
jgi:AraC-like DNA-binding protein